MICKCSLYSGYKYADRILIQRTGKIVICIQNDKLCDRDMFLNLKGFER